MLWVAEYHDPRRPVLHRLKDAWVMGLLRDP